MKSVASKLKSQKKTNVFICNMQGSFQWRTVDWIFTLEL